MIQISQHHWQTALYSLMSVDCILMHSTYFIYSEGWVSVNSRDKERVGVRNFFQILVSDFLNIAFEFFLMSHKCPIKVLSDFYKTLTNQRFTMATC